MPAQAVLSVSVLALGILISAGLLAGLYAQHRGKPGVAWLFVSILCTFLWSVGYLLEIIPAGLDAKVFWAKFQFIGISFVTVAIFGFGLVYTRRGHWLTRARIILLCIIPALTVLAAYTNEYHGGIWSQIALQGQGAYLPLDLTHGWWFWVSTGYSYILLVSVTAFMLQSATSRRNLFRTQGRIMLAGILVPWVSNVLYIFDISPVPNLDFTPIAFTFTNIAFSIGLYRYRLLDVLPLAHETVLDAMSEAILILDREQRIADSNAAAQRIFNARSQELFGLPANSLLPDWEQQPVTSGGRELRLELGGQKRIFRLRVYPITDQSGQHSGQILLLADITDYRQAETQIALQLTALTAAENAIVITDHQGNIEWANPAFTTITGYTLEEARGRNPRFLKSGQHDQAFYRALWETIQSGRVWRGDIYNRRKDGSTYYESMTITPLVQPGGEISHYVAVKEDITKRKLHEQDLLETNRLKTQLLANVSHDLRTPLGVIIGYTEMLLDGYYGKLVPAQENVLREIVGNSDRLLVFIENLIGQAQIESGRLVLRQNQFEPEQLLRAVQEFGSLLAEKQKITLEHHAEPGLPPVLLGDLYWLKQIILNLVSNSLRFTKKGGVRVRLYMPGPEEWAIEVADTGIGIAPADQQIIFEPFRQAEAAQAKQRSGSGLGLSIVRDLSRLMNGRIELQSEVDQGTTIRVIFPLLKLEGAK
jgi:PAS domain S-box-containing protein